MLGPRGPGPVDSSRPALRCISVRGPETGWKLKKLSERKADVTQRTESPNTGRPSRMGTAVSRWSLVPMQRPWAPAVWGVGEKRYSVQTAPQCAAGCEAATLDPPGSEATPGRPLSGCPAGRALPALVGAGQVRCPLPHPGPARHPQGFVSGTWAQPGKRRLPPSVESELSQPRGADVHRQECQPWCPTGRPHADESPQSSRVTGTGGRGRWWGHAALLGPDWDRRLVEQGFQEPLVRAAQWAGLRQVAALHRLPLGARSGCEAPSANGCWAGCCPCFHI